MSHLADRQRLKSCLLQSASCQSMESSARTSHESLMKLLLSIDVLQTPLVQVLLEIFPEFMGVEVSDDGVDVSRQILNQLKWLDKVVDCQNLTKKLLELVSIAPADVQRDIITCLPEIIDDSHHQPVAMQLRQAVLHQFQNCAPLFSLSLLTNPWQPKIAFLSFLSRPRSSRSYTASWLDICLHAFLSG
uniref:Uncharacterized protein n=1 Tax=Eptatretus burgeri TaxID=7764 RepID=A0A8C4WUE9_EPTBU